jgi:hypothetical protein
MVQDMGASVDSQSVECDTVQKADGLLRLVVVHMVIVH